MWQCSRRGFTASILAFLFGPGRMHGRAAASTPVPSPPISPDASAAGSTSRTTVRRYRADAVILLLGIPIFKRAGVGGGQVSVEETGEGAQMRRTLFFAGGSDPQRAHGFNRLGWIREVALGPGPVPPEAGYFGVLTASPEESLEHARKSMAAPPSGRSFYSAVNGRHTAGHSRSAVTHFEFTSAANWSDRGLIDEAQSTFHNHVAWRDTAWPNSLDHAPPTFLFAMAALLKPRANHAAGRYVYSEQEYLLDLEGSSRGGPSERLWAVRGGIRNLRTGHQTVFRLWLDNSPGSVVPVRIEFQPRSFLRLTFEALPD